MVQLHSPAWSDPPPELDMPGYEIHIWSINLDSTDNPVQKLAQTLSTDEQQRAQRFRFEHDRDRFIVGRGRLREMLSRYLRVEPIELKFSYGVNGKPELAASYANAKLEFNLAHSETLMLCAVAQHRQVGIDLEHIRPIPDLLHLTERFFADQEHCSVQASSGEEQLKQFFYLWTCKEALLKARGMGIVALNQVELLIHNGVFQQIRWMPQPQHLKGWQIGLFSPAPRYVAAIASIDIDSPEASSRQKERLQDFPCLQFWRWKE